MMEVILLLQRELGKEVYTFGGNSLVQIHKFGSSEIMINANADGSVELYHNNVKKSLKLVGVTITGNLQFAVTHGSDSNTQIFTEPVCIITNNFGITSW